MKTFIHRLLFGVVALTSYLPTSGADHPAQISMDLVAPEIHTINAPDTVYAGSDVKIEAVVSDNQGLKSVILFYRRKGSSQYSKLAMKRGSNVNSYITQVKHLTSPGIEYYVEATDLAGNQVRNGQDYSPYSISALSELDESIIQNIQPGRLKDREILMLFSNNTVNGRHLRKDFNFVRYYSGDGRLIGVNNLNGKRKGHWRVAGTTLCEQFDKQWETCHDIVKEDDTIKKYATTRSGDRVVVVVYKRFRYGNPENFE